MPVSPERAWGTLPAITSRLLARARPEGLLLLLHRGPARQAPDPAASREGAPLGYDRHCRDLQNPRRPAHGARGGRAASPHVVRLKVPAVGGRFAFHDLLRGEVTRERQGDRRPGAASSSDGLPNLSHLANVVDDHLMEISPRDPRPREWISSTQKHVACSTGAVRPGTRRSSSTCRSFAQRPTRTRPDQQAQAARSRSTTYPRQIGILPEALLNFPRHDGVVIRRRSREVHAAGDDRRVLVGPDLAPAVRCFNPRQADLAQRESTCTSLTTEQARPTA